MHPFLSLFTVAAATAVTLSVVPAASQMLPSPDWLITRNSTPVTIVLDKETEELTIQNGLVKLTFTTKPNCALVGYKNLVTDESVLRAVSPLADVTLAGRRYDIGGLQGQPDRAFLRPDWIKSLTAIPSSFRFTGYSISEPKERFQWKRTRPAEDLPWPAPGKVLTLHFAPPLAGDAPTITVDVHYRLYEGQPLVCKWITLTNHGMHPVRVNSFTSEILAAVEGESSVGDPPDWRLPNIGITTDYSFGGDNQADATHTVHWVADPQYTTQVNYELHTPCLLEVRPPLGPDTDIPPHGAMETFRTWELLYDTTDRVRKGLENCRMYRTIAPWTTENPLMLHLTSTTPDVVKTAIDQAAECGFEMVIFSFGSGLNMEDETASNIARFREFADYAHSKGLQIGGYSLLASRSIDAADDVINPKTGKPGGAIFGNSPCLCSKWGIEYFQHIKHFLTSTGFDLLENDGSYPGDVCASTTHPGHHGLLDSQWQQFWKIAHFYRWCRERGIYLNVPDWYFLQGSNKSGMGYRETNWSLPRDLQHLHARQNMYDGTWNKTPSMGWMFVPLVQYHGGGAAATIEPLHEHIDDYREHIMDCLLYGVQACYRGPRLYDTPTVRKMVQTCVKFFKKHRAILQSDIVHLRRPDGEDWDGILHVNPSLHECGLAAFFNPLQHSITRTIQLPLYYTGLTTSAMVSTEGKRAKKYRLNRQFGIAIEVTIPAHGFTWCIITRPPKQ